MRYFAHDAGSGKRVWGPWEHLDISLLITGTRRSLLVLPRKLDTLSLITDVGMEVLCIAVDVTTAALTLTRAEVLTGK